MNAASIVDQLIVSKILISAVEGELKVKAPKGAMTKALMTLIGDNKSALLAYLSQEQAMTQDDSALPPIVALPRDRKVELPLSFAQERLWFIDQMAGGSSEYNIPVAIKIDGDFDIETAQQALRHIIRRHEVLRTVFAETIDGPVQVIADAFDFKISTYDLRGLVAVNEDSEQQQRLSALMNEEFLGVFDLSKDLMLRASYVHMSTNHGVLLFNIHHIASDGWSMSKLVIEFVQNYQFLLNDQAELVNKIHPPLVIQFADFAKWQRQWLTGAVLDTLVQYWRKTLDDVPVLHSVPLDFPRPALKSYQGKVVKGALSASVSEKLRVQANQYGVTPFMLLHGALCLVLSRHSYNSDIVVGTPIANRSLAEIEPLIGFFVNTLVLRVNTGHQLLGDYFAHVKQVILDAQAHKDIPFEQLVTLSDVPRTLSYTPLFQIMFTINTNDDINLTIPGAQLSMVQRTEQVAKFDLDIEASIGSDGIEFNWIYDTSIFCEASVEKLNGHLVYLLESLAQSPNSECTSGVDCRIEHLPMWAAEEELEHSFDVHSDESQPKPEPLCVHQMFERQVLATPANEALYFEQQSYDYQTLNAKANQLARLLRACGVKSQTLVGVYLPRSLDMVVALLAVLKAGGAYVPLDPNYPQSRIRGMVRDSQLEFCLTYDALMISLPNDGSIDIIALDLAQQKAQIEAYDNTNLTALPDASATDLCYVIYTSGSTGAPKGVMIQHNNLANYLTGMGTVFGRVFGRTLAVTTIAFDIAGTELFAPLVHGGCIVLVEQQQVANPQYLAEILLDQGITCMQATPATWQLLCEFGWLGKSDLVALCGGEALPPALASELLPRCDQLWNCYGPTEATIWSMVNKVEQDPLGQNLIVAGTLPDYSHLILDHQLQIAPRGAAGELCIGGRGLARGYLNQPQLTKERFIHLSTQTSGQQRVYRTGDLVRMVGKGQFEFLGRIDDQVKIRGFRIELGEIQYQLGQCEQVKSSVVVARDDSSGSKTLLAYIIVASKVEDEHQYEHQKSIILDIKQKLAEVLPDYMVPAIFVVVEQWPLTPNGKIDKKRLPEPDIHQLQHEYVSPQSDIEHGTVKIWATLLNIEADSISISANFFDLGGHSLLLIRLITAVERDFGVRLGIAQLMTHNTIKSMAEVIEHIRESHQLRLKLEVTQEQTERLEF